MPIPTRQWARMGMRVHERLTWQPQRPRISPPRRFRHLHLVSFFLFKFALKGQLVEIFFAQMQVWNLGFSVMCFKSSKINFGHTDLYTQKTDQWSLKSKLISNSHFSSGQLHQDPSQIAALYQGANYSESYNQYGLTNPSQTNNGKFLNSGSTYLRHKMVLEALFQ